MTLSLKGSAVRRSGARFASSRSLCGDGSAGAVRYSVASPLCSGCRRPTRRTDALRSSQSSFRVCRREDVDVGAERDELVVTGEVKERKREGSGFPPRTRRVVIRVSRHACRSTVGDGDIEASMVAWRADRSLPKRQAPSQQDHLCVSRATAHRERGRGSGPLDARSSVPAQSIGVQDRAWGGGGGGVGGGGAPASRRCRFERVSTLS